MNCDELAKIVAKELKVTHAEAKKHLFKTVEVIQEQILKGQKISLRGFGTFYIDISEERNFFNPSTQKHEKKPRSFRLKYDFSRTLIAKIYAKKTHS